MKKSSFTILILIGIIFSLSIVQTGLSNRLSTKGISASKIESEINYYKTQNAILSEKLFSYSSLTSLVSRAMEAGFIKERNEITLGLSEPLAIKQ